MQSHAEPSTTLFVADCIDKLQKCDDESERQLIYKAMYERAYNRMHLLAHKIKLRTHVPEVFTDDVNHAAFERLTNIMTRDDLQNWRNKMSGLRDVLNLAARHMRLYLLTVIETRSKRQTFTDCVLESDSAVTDMLMSLFPANKLMDEHVDPQRLAINQEIWNVFPQMERIDAHKAELLEQSLILGLSNVELASVHGVDESTIRDRLFKARLLFLKLYGKEWPF